MVEAIFCKAIAIGILCLVFVQGGDILEYFRPSPKLPKELNEFLATVQEHKGDFELIREAAQKVKIKKDHKNEANKDILGLKQTEGNYLEHKYLQRRWADDRPKNDIYPYLYASQPHKNSKYNINEKEIRIEPRSKTGDTQRSEQKYPGRRFVDIQRETNDIDYDDDRDTVFGNNKYQNNQKKSIRKREIEIDVKDDGKLIKRIREQDVSSKSLVLNIHPKKEKNAITKPANVQNRNQETETIQKDENASGSLVEKLKDREFNSNFENLYRENENLNTDRSLAAENIPTQLFYQVTYPDKPESYPLELENNLPENLQSQQHNIDYENSRIEPSFESDQNIPVQPFPTENPIYPKLDLQTETTGGFENVQSVVLDTNSKLHESFNVESEQKPEKRQLFDMPNFGLNSQDIDADIPAMENSLLKNDFGRSISDFALPQNDLDVSPEEGYQLLEQSTTKIFTENYGEGQAIVQERHGTLTLGRKQNSRPEGECVAPGEQSLSPGRPLCIDNGEATIKEMERKIEEVGNKLEAGGTPDIKTALVREEMKIQEEENKMQNMEKKIECLEHEIKQDEAGSKKSNEINEVENKIEEEEDQINEIEEKLDDIENKMDEERVPSEDGDKSQQENLKCEIKKVQEAEEKIAIEAQKIEAHEKQLAEAVGQRQPNKFAFENSPKIQKEIGDTNIASGIAHPQNIIHENAKEVVDGNKECIDESNSANDLIEQSGARQRKIDTIEIIESDGHPGDPEVKFFTEKNLILDDVVKRTERALALPNNQRYIERIPVRDANGKIRKIYVIHRDGQESNSDENGRSPRRHDKKRKRKKKKHKHRPSFDDYIDNDYINKFYEEDPNNNSDTDLIPAFKSRHLQAMYNADIDTEDSDDYEDDQNHESAGFQVTKRTNAIEGDYSDDEEPSGTKNRKDKFAKIKKKSENEFADPAETTKFDEYYDDDDFGNKKTKMYHKQPKMQFKDHKPPLHEIFEETFGFHNPRNSGSHLQKRAHHGHSKKKKKLEPKPENPKRIEPERKIVKDEFKHLKKSKKIKVSKRQRSTPKKATFNDAAEQQKLPKFVIDDRIQQENIRKRSLDNIRRLQRSNIDKFPISTRNFFIKPEKGAEQPYKMGLKRTEWNSQKKRAQPFSLDPVSIVLPESGGSTDGANRIEKGSDEHSEPLENREVKAAAPSAGSETGTSESIEVGVSVGNVCEEDNATTPVVLETMLAIVPDMQLDNTSVVSTNMLNDAENTTSLDGLNTATGLCVKTSSHTKLDDIINGFLPSKLVSDIKNKIKEIPNLSKRFEHGLLKQLKMDTSMLDSNESTIEIKKLMVAVTEIMSKIAETASCQKLPHPIQEYVNYLTKNEKGDVLSKPKEMEDIKFNDNENADNYLYDQSLHEKLNVMKELLERYSKLPDNCKVRAEPVKEYIESHLGMLSNMTQESNLHSKRSYDESSINLDEKNEQPFDEVLFHTRGSRVNKRDVNHNSQSKQYQKLVDAVARMRHKRENERMIGELFGGGQDSFGGGGEAGAGGGYESPLVYSV